MKGKVPSWTFTLQVPGKEESVSVQTDYPVWEHSSNTQSWSSHQCPVPAGRGSSQFSVPPPKVIPFPAICNEGARCPACNWPATSSSYPSVGLGPIDCDPHRFRWGRDMLVTAWKPGPGHSEWLQQGLWDCASQSLSPSSSVHYPAQHHRDWRALGESCKRSFTRLC